MYLVLTHKDYTLFNYTSKVMLFFNEDLLLDFLQKTLLPDDNATVSFYRSWNDFMISTKGFYCGDLNIIY